ncbi:primase homolog protein-like isoform X5 [Vitis riparia]|nr:primase homolog protein-like isoform X5 [Vitis riparia]
MERSLSLHITQDRNFAMWRCFRSTCGWAGRVLLESSAAYSEVTNNWMTVDSLGLEPLGDKLIAYFGERMISEKTLYRNAVMQLSGNQSGQLIIMSVIAFTYRQNGLLVGCKYRSMGKRFWQEKGTEKILYGLDDIQEANEIIIVEGELDKLSVEEAGFCNCVSVPGGAPQKVSAKELPSLDKDTAYHYLWNCKEYLDKASRIILATDGDSPGQALAEELARRLGKERCWRVSWPKKEDSSCFKDANEVLKNLGADALREVIENAELYEVNSSIQEI